MIIGGAMDTIGTAILASGADARKKKQEEIANTPGLDFGALTGQALTGYNQNFGAASSLAARAGTANQAQLGSQEEQALPGVGAARQRALGSINSLFGDSAEWLKGVQRRGAALGLASGLGGSGAGQLATLHLSDQEQMQRTQLGTGLLGSLIGSLRMANTPGVQAFLGPDPSQQVAIRGQERAQRIAMLSGAAAMPSGLETWGQRLQQVGSTLAGAGVGSQGLGIPGGMNGGYSYNTFGMGGSQGTLAGDLGGTGMAGKGWG